MKFPLVQGMGHLTPSAAAVMLLACGGMLTLSKEAEARAYKCFDRQTGEQVAVSDVDITTPSISCLPSDGYAPQTPSLADPDDGDTDGWPDSSPEDISVEDDEPTTPESPSPSTFTPSTSADPLAARRAINLARGTAVSLNGGLSQYRPASCMFRTAAGNPCLTRSDTSGLEFTIPGGKPGWEESGDNPNVLTVVIISPDGRTVLESIQN